MTEESLALEGKWLRNLLESIEDNDYCYLCDSHPSHGHALDCPVGEH